VKELKLWGCKSYKTHTTSKKWQTELKTYIILRVKKEFLDMRTPITHILL